MQQLAELTAPARRLALVGLAKNTGKTETLAALLRELQARGRRVGVTSVGRDGEERDVIDIRIEKPRVELCAGASSPPPTRCCAPVRFPMRSSARPAYARPSDAC